MERPQDDGDESSESVLWALVSILWTIVIIMLSAVCAYFIAGWIIYLTFELYRLVT